METRYESATRTGRDYKKRESNLWTFATLLSTPGSKAETSSDRAEVKQEKGSAKRKECAISFDLRPLDLGRWTGLLFVYIDH